MNNIRLLLFVSAMLVCTVISCDDTNPPVDHPPVLRCGDYDGGALVGGEHTLLGTSWELVGFCDLKTNEFTLVEPKDCKGEYALECNTLTFFEKGPQYILYVSHPSYENLKPNPDKIGMSNDEALNQIFKEFGVFGYYQSFPGAQNPELLHYYEIYFMGDIDSLESVLKEKMFFRTFYHSDIYTSDFSRCRYVDNNYAADGAFVLLGASSYHIIGCYFVDYARTTINFASEYYIYDETYADVMDWTRTFEWTDSGLKLYYGNNYLLLRPVASN